MTKKFNIMADIVGKGEKSEREMKLIDYELLKDDNENFYSMEDIEKFADEIESCGGIMQPLLVRYASAEHEGGYIITSGHRRIAALKAIIQKKKEAGENADKFSKVPCYVEEAETDEKQHVMTDIKRILTNKHREKTITDRMMESQKLEESLKRYKELGGELPGRMRDIKAYILEMSPSQVGKLDKVARDLHTDLKEELDKGTLTMDEANKLASLPKEEQKEAHKNKKFKVKRVWSRWFGEIKEIKYGCAEVWKVADSGDRFESRWKYEKNGEPYSGRYMALCSTEKQAAADATKGLCKELEKHGCSLFGIEEACHSCDDYTHCKAKRENEKEEKKIWWSECNEYAPNQCEQHDIELNSGEIIWISTAKGVDGEYHYGIGHFTDSGMEKGGFLPSRYGAGYRNISEALNAGIRYLAKYTGTLLSSKDMPRKLYESGHLTNEEYKKYEQKDERPTDLENNLESEPPSEEEKHDDAGKAIRHEDTEDCASAREVERTEKGSADDEHYSAEENIDALGRLCESLDTMKKSYRNIAEWHPEEKKSIQCAIEYIDTEIIPKVEEKMKQLKGKDLFDDKD